MAAPSGSSSNAQGMASRVYEAYALSAPGANTSFPTAGIKFARRASRCRVFIVLTTSSVLNYYVDNGTTQYTNGLNSSTALNAGDAYEFEFDVGYSSDGSETGTRLTYYFRVETDSVIRQMIVTEVTGP